MKIQALIGKVVVEVLDEDNRTASGLYVARSGKERPLRGRVLSCGRDKHYKDIIFKCPCKTGDVIHYKRFTSQQINSRFDGMRISTVYFGDIVAVERDNQLIATDENVIVQVFYKDTSSVIYIPDKFRSQISCFLGYVHSVGENYPNKLTIGEKIIFPRSEGFPIMFKEVVYHSLYPEHVKAKISDEKEMA